VCAVLMISLAFLLMLACPLLGTISTAILFYDVCYDTMYDI
jgi:hypothetical protein